MHRLHCRQSPTHPNSSGAWNASPPASALRDLPLPFPSNQIVGFFYVNKWWYLAVSVVVALLFSAYLVYDIQAGSAKPWTIAFGHGISGVPILGAVPDAHALCCLGAGNAKTPHRPLPCLLQLVMGKGAVAIDPDEYIFASVQVCGLGWHAWGFAWPAFLSCCQQGQPTSGCMRRTLAPAPAFATACSPARPPARP